MGKPKKRFNEKKDAVKFQIVYRSVEDPNYTKGTLADRVFHVIDEKKSQKVDPTREAKKSKILSGFSDQDLGKFTTPRKIVNNEIEADEETQKQYEIEDSYDDLDKKTKKKVKGIEGRNDLWINHLHKSKAENSINEQKIKPVGKEEEWEDCEDYDENYEDLEEIEEEDYEEEKKIEKKTEVKSKINGLSELSETILAREDPLNILKTFEVNKNVKMKYYDENGLLVDGYDYYQHIAKKDTEGTVTMVYNAEYEYPPQLKPDIDYQPEEMNAEQKEVFDALEYEGPEAYENLEDNFVDIANDGEKCLDSKKPIKDLVAEKQQEDLMKELEESEDKLPDIQGVINKHDFNRIVHEYIAHMEKKHEKKAETNNKNPSKKPLKELEEEEERESNPELEDDIKRPDIKPEIMDKIDKDELFTRKMYEKLDPTEDICLQQYLMKDSSDELDTDQEPNTKKIEINSPTIEDNSKNLSLPTPKLNIIKEKYGPRKQKKAKDAKSETTNAENDSNITKIEHKDIFKKREKEETQEEKTERKAKIKTFKNERKEKKKKFKEELKYQQSNELKKNKPNHNIAHVSVYKL